MKSSAMSPRQPSVPNLISLDILGSIYSVISTFRTKHQPRYGEQRFCMCLVVETRNRKFELCKPVQLLRIEVFDDLADILCLLPGRDEQRARSLHNPQIIHADRRDELARGVNVITAGIQEKCARSRHQVAVWRIALRVVMFVQRRPRTQIVPAKIRRQAKDASLDFAFCRAWFQHSVVYADVFALGIQLAK